MNFFHWKEKLICGKKSEAKNCTPIPLTNNCVFILDFIFLKDLFI